jgi:hypothetical protein
MYVKMLVVWASSGVVKEDKRSTIGRLRKNISNSPCSMIEHPIETGAPQQLG